MTFQLAMRPVVETLGLSYLMLEYSLILILKQLDWIDIAPSLSYLINGKAVTLEGSPASLVLGATT